MNTLYMMVGIAGSGKSTFANDMATDIGAVVVSTDEIRGLLYGDESIQGDGSKVFAIAKDFIRFYLSLGYSVIFDATNVKASYRKEFLSHFDNVRKEAIAIEVPYEIAMEQNKKRKRRVPKCVIKRMYDGYERPSVSEGFDCVSILVREEE